MVGFGAYFINGDYPRIKDWIVASEKAGFETLWLTDSQLIWRDLYAYMGMAALLTSRMKIGSAVSNPLTRHWTVTAGGHASVHEMTGGRVILGLGRGDSAVRTMGQKPRSIEELRRCITFTRALMRGEGVPYNGVEVRIPWADAGPVPIYVAASGPRVMQLAGEIADGVILQVGAMPEAVEWAMGHIRAGAAEAGRTLEGFAVCLLTATHVGEDLQQARPHVVWAPACASNHVFDVLRYHPRESVPEVMVRDMEVMREKYDYYEHCEGEADHTRYVTDEMIRNYAIVGPPQAFIEKVRTLEALGITEVTTGFLNGRPEEIDKLGKLVIPHC